MYAKNPPDIIHHLEGLIKGHALCVDHCMAQAHRIGAGTKDHDLIKRYVGDHKLMGGELSMLLKGLGADTKGGTRGSPGRMMQSAPEGLAGMMAALDRGIEKRYLSMLEAGSIPVAIEEKALLHVTFLRRLQLHIAEYAENMGNPEINRPAPPARAKMTTQSREQGGSAHDKPAVARRPRYPG